MNQNFAEVARLDTNEPLTEWAKEPSVMDLQADLQMAKPSHDAHVSEVEEWLNLRNVEGKAKAKTSGNRSSVQPKLVRKQAEWRYSALSEAFLSAEKLFDIKPVTWEDHEGARQNDLLINNQFETKLPRVSFIDNYVRTTVDEGTCYVKPGWIRETRIEQVEVPVWSYFEDASPENIEMLQQAIDLKTQNPQGYEELDEALKAAVEYAIETNLPVIAMQDGITMVDQEVVVRNQPSLDIVNFRNVFLDPSCNGDYTKANFAIISFETSKAKLIADGRYKNLDRVNWSSNSPLHEPNHATSSDPSAQFKDELRKTVVAYEYWGFYDVKGDNTLTPIVATWIGNTMIRMEENPYPDQKIPLVLVPYMPVKDSATGEPDAALLADNQAILGATTRGIIDLMGRSANGQTAFAKGMLDTVNRRKFDRGEDYEFNPQMPPNAGIFQHQYPEIPASALQVIQMQSQEAESLTGVKAFSGGLSGQAYGDVAAGIRGMLDASAKREMSILRRLAAGMEEIGRKIVAMNQAFLSEEEVIQVTNEQFVKVTREDLKGQFNIKVDLSTAEIEEAKAQDLGFMLQTMGNTLPFEMTQHILVEIARLKRMPKLAKMMESYKPQPDPLQEKLKELEIAKIDAQIAELRAKAMLAEAKARSEASEADLKDLDFLEQETGTKHAREMQKQQAQAESNQLLEVTKGVLAPKEKKPAEKDLMRAVQLHNVAASRASV